MATKPNEKLLDRHVQKVENREYLAHVDRALTEAVNRATQVFARCWTSVPDTLLGQVPLMLFRHVVEMVDATHVLVVESASAPARAQLRSAFEALVYLEFMLEADVSLRTKTYIAQSYLWGLQLARRLRKGSGERKAFFKELGPRVAGDAEFGRSFMTTSADVQRYQDFLDSPVVRDGYQLLLDFKKKRRRWPSAWYQAVDPTLANLKDLCVHLGRAGQYVGYDLWSRSVHPDLLAVHSITPPDGEPQRIRKLRDGDRISDAVRTSVAFIRDGCGLALEHARPAERQQFLKSWEKEVDPLIGELTEETVWTLAEAIR